MQALDRLIAILEAVAARTHPAAPAEIAQEMKLPLSTVARLMRQLADAGLLYRSPEEGRYSLGSRVFALAGNGLANIGLAESALPAMRELRDACGETVSLHVLRGAQRICIAEVQSQHPVRRVVPPGMAQGIPGTATGEALLAGARESEVEAALAGAELDAGARRQLDARLASVREQGFSVRDDFVENLTGISVPIRQGGRTIAALTVSGPSSRFDRLAAEQLAPQLLAVADGLSRLA